MPLNPLKGTEKASIQFIRIDAFFFGMVELRFVQNEIEWFEIDSFHLNNNYLNAYYYSLVRYKIS